MIYHPKSNFAVGETICVKSMMSYVYTKHKMFVVSEKATTTMLTICLVEVCSAIQLHLLKPSVLYLLLHIDRGREKSEISVFL